MKFEENIEALAGAIIDALGKQATGHHKLQGLGDPQGAKGASRRERIEVMLEVALELLERKGGEGASGSGQVLEAVKALRDDFKVLVGRLENLKVKVPKAAVSDHSNVGLAHEVAEVKVMLAALSAGQARKTTIKRLWWAVGVLAAALILLSLYLLR